MTTVLERETDTLPPSPAPPAPIQIVTTRWICPFCHRGRSRLKPALEHMGRCWKNPDLRGCKTCVFFAPNKQGGSCRAGYNIKPGLVTQCKKWKTKTLP